MPKLPKMSELTDVSGIMSKVKSAFENITGPSSSAASEEALAKETDPSKAKLLEVEILIGQLNDLAIIQNKTLNELKSQYAEVKQLANEALTPKTSEESKAPKAKTQGSDTSKETAAQAKPVANETAPKDTSQENATKEE